MARELFWMPVYCRLVHRPKRYPVPTWVHWRYAFCDKCMCYRWVVVDWLLNIILGRGAV